MEDVKIVETINKDDVPKGHSRTSMDYSPILKAVATLDNNECLVLEVPQKKKHRLNGIKTAIKKQFKATKYKVTSRSNKEKEVLNIYIHKS